MFNFHQGILLKLIALITIVSVMASCSGGNEVAKHDIPFDKIMPGDIAFRRGEGLVSDIVLFNDADGKYSHIGVVVAHNDSLKIVHAVPGENSSPDDFDRVRIDLIDDFFSPERASKGEIMRIEMADSQRQAVSTMALEKAKAKVPFDHNYNLSDTSKLYCTELLQLLFANAGINLAEERVTDINCPGFSGRYLMPSDIHKNKKLKAIYIY